MRKTFLKTLAFAALFCTLLTVSVFAEDAEITGNDVNFRSGPGTDYAIYECLPYGTVVTVTDRSNSEWYGVTYGGHTGFISSSYLSVSAASVPEPAAEPEPAATVTEQPVSSGASINAMYVRMRSGPGSDYSILGEYNKGTSLTVTGVSGLWYAVVLNGQNGYVYADYVDLGDTTDIPVETPQPTPEPTPAPTPEPAPVVTPEPAPVTTPSEYSAGHIRGDYVYFRTGPSTSYSIYDCLADGTALTITGISGDWYAVTIGDKSGYVYASYVVNDGGEVATLPVETPQPTPEPTPEPAPAPVENISSAAGYISGNDVRFRGGPSTRDDILGTYNYGTALTITGSSGEWKAVIINGQAGYVYGQYVSEGSVTVIGDDPNVSASGREVVEFALQYVGYPYTWGGTSPETGFDCSGFTTFVFKHFGITLNRVACDQASNGVEVDPSALQPGDLLCFYSSADYIGHVGIYIGDNKFVHASTYTTGVIISELSGYYTVRSFVARRIV